MKKPIRINLNGYPTYYFDSSTGYSSPEQQQKKNN